MRYYLWIWAFLPIACASAASPSLEPTGSGTDSTSEGGVDAPPGQAESHPAGSADAGAPSEAALPCHSGGVACGGRCVNTSADPQNCGQCGNVCEAGLCMGGICAAPCDGGGCTTTGTATLDISNAYIDNVSDLVIQGNTARWTVLAGDPPGQHGGNNEPTTINGTNWFPQFACANPCDSSNTTPVPPLAQREQTVILGDWGNGRGGGGTVTIKQQPTAPDYVLKIEFSDPPGGASHYHAKVTYSTQ